MSTKVQVLFTLMQDGSKVSVDKMLKVLNIKQGSVMCLISALRNDFGAEIETERDGRKVLSYQLTNPSKVKLPTKAAKVAKTATKSVASKPASKTAVAKVVKTIKNKERVIKEDEFDVPTLDADLSVSEVTDSELADLRHQLGL
jgi:biotin operon repressor